MAKQGIIRRVLGIIARAKVNRDLRRLEAELDRRAARILTKEEQRAERDSWAKQEYGQ